MDLIIDCRDYFIPLIQEFEKYNNEDELDAKFFDEFHDSLREMKPPTARSNLTPFGKQKFNGAAIQDEKENFLMPAPRLRPLRNMKKTSKGGLRSKSSVDSSSNPPSRVTRASHKRMTKNKSSILDEGESLRPRRTTRSKTLISTVNSSFDVEVDEILKPRRVTRSRVKDVSICSSTNENIEEIVCSKRANRSRAKDNSMLSSSDVELENVVRLKRATRCRMECASINNSVSLDIGELKGKKTISKETNISDIVNNIASVHISMKNEPASPSPIKISSPVVKKSKRLNKKKPKELVEEISIAEDDKIPDEIEDVVITGKSPTQNETKCDTEVMEEIEVDNEWVSDEENEEKEKSAKKSNPLFSSTPRKLEVVPKVTEVAISYKSLRSRRVKKVSTDTLGLKSKVSSNKLNNLPCLTSVQQPKVNDIEVKEEELKKMIEKETEALKRKKELMKKRTETTKRKREEKMDKVRRTRQEIEIERKNAKKLKKGRAQAGKKKTSEVAEVELKSILSPIVKAGTPKCDVNVSFDTRANVTFEVKAPEKENDVDVYNMTPCWQEVTPVQPDNPNDYGMVDKSDCSSDEEGDPRKKIPKWAQILPNHPKFLMQSFLTLEFVKSYWGCKPRALTIKEFFGVKVSHRTMRRGLNYRTSSACWNSPPVKALKD